MTEIELIQSKIDKLPKGEPFGIGYLANIGSYENVRQVLSRLVTSGKLKRPARGVYVRPKEVPYLGEVMPTAEEVVTILAKQTGEAISIHGAEAARQLGLSTQVSLRPIFNTSGTSREIKVGKQIVSLKHISPRKQIQPSTIICTVIAALWYIGKNNVNESVINKIKQKLTAQKFAELLRYTHKMPHWMASAFKNYK